MKGIRSVKNQKEIKHCLNEIIRTIVDNDLQMKRKKEIESHVVNQLISVQKSSQEEKEQKAMELAEQQKKERIEKRNLERGQMLLDESTTLQEKVKRMSEHAIEMEVQMDQKRKQAVAEEIVYQSWKRLILFEQILNKRKEEKGIEIEKMKAELLSKHREDIIELESRLRKEFDMELIKEKEIQSKKMEEEQVIEKKKEKKQENEAVDTNTVATDKTLTDELQQSKLQIVQLKKDMNELRFQKEEEMAELVRKMRQRQQNNRATTEKHSSNIPETEKIYQTFAPSPPKMYHNNNNNENVTKTLDLERDLREANLKTATVERDLYAEKSRSSVLSLEIMKLRKKQKSKSKAYEMSIVER